jgi:hypothetical protein
MALFRFFIRLARLQQAPQDLPASTTLLLLLVIGDIAIGTATRGVYFGNLPKALLANLTEAAVLAGMVWLLLSVNDRQPRFTQTTTALFGLGVLYELMMLLPHLLALATGASQLAGLLMLALLVWLHVAMGHVLRHAMDQSLGVGIALAVGVSAVTFVVVVNLFPPPATAPAG